jgi:hypothetical protein
MTTSIPTPIPAITLAEKAHAYCDINDMVYPERLDAPAYDLLESPLYTMCHAWNTHWLWQLAHGEIDDVAFFQIGDLAMAPGISDAEWDAPLQIVESWDAAPLKQPRPHLDACDLIAAECTQQTLYSIDYAAQIAYTHRAGADAWDALLQKVAAHQSAILCI